jgi:uncharacterized protein (TIGR02757 family)
MKRATTQRLRSCLERLRTTAIRNRCVERDPLQYVQAYGAPADREIAGILAALLAYGRVDPMRAHIREVLSHLGTNPASRLRESVPRLPRLVYRFHRTRDLHALLRGIRSMLVDHENLGDAFASHRLRSGDLRMGLSGFVSELRTAAGRAGPGLRYLLPDPALGGACKRWHLYLRWMVRSGQGDPDLGVWSDRVPASALLIPLDTHVVRVSRRLGLTSRRTPNWKMSEEVTAALRQVNADDPVRYDFALCHLGIDGICSPQRDPEQCRKCALVRPHRPPGEWGL